MTNEPNYLAENMSYIKRYNNKIEKILNIEISLKDFEFKNLETDNPILFYQGHALNSSNNPIEESEKVFNAIADKDNGDTIHVLIGIGIGYEFKALAQNIKGKLVLFEPRHEILKAILELVDFSEELCLRNVIVTTSSEEFIKVIEFLYKKNCNFTFTTTPIYKKLLPNLATQLNDIIQKMVPEEYNGGPLKLNIGPGKWYKEGWKRLDCYSNMTNFDIDLRKMTQLPLEDNVIEKVFSSHCIEHIEDSHLDILIKELYRCMQPDGILRFACPDADQALEAYRTGNKDWFFWLPQKSIEKMLINTFVSYERGGPDVPDELIREKFAALEKEDFIRWCISRADRTRPYIAHINGHYFDKLYKKLFDAGFVNIKRSTYRGSEDEELRSESFDLYPNFSLYIECRKPKN